MKQLIPQAENVLNPFMTIYFKGAIDNKFFFINNVVVELPGFGLTGDIWLYMATREDCF